MAAFHFVHSLMPFLWNVYRFCFLNRMHAVEYRRWVCSQLHVNDV